MNFPSQFYEYLFAKGEVGQVNHDYDSNGNEIYTGISSRVASANNPAWVIWHGVYVQNGAGIWEMTHESYLEGVIWALRSTYIYP